MLNIGQVNELTVFKTTIEGHYLKADGSDLEVLMPFTYGPRELEVGQKVSAFTYYEDDRLLMATTKIPKAMVGEFAVMDVVEVKQFGAFFDWNS